MSDKKINGYQIREAIKHWILQRDVNLNQFKDSLFSFEDEKKDSPDVVMDRFKSADRTVARLEEIQQLYNQRVMCNTYLGEISLALCVKLVGGAGRMEKMWRESTVGKKDRYSYHDDARERDNSKQYATRQLSVADCSERSQLAAKYASAIRNAIARGNATDVPIDELHLTSEEFKTIFE